MSVHKTGLITALACSMAGIITSPAQAQVSDACEDAPELAVGTYEFTTVGATTDTTPSCRPDAALGVWLKHTATTNGVIVIRTCGILSAITAYDTCNTAQLYCNSNPFIHGCPSARQLVVPTTVGHTTLFRIAEVTGATMSGQFEIFELSTPSNDTCNTATIAQNGTTYPFDTTAASESFVPGWGDSLDIWYSFTAPGAANQLNEVVISSCGDITHYSALYTTCGGPRLDNGDPPLLANSITDCSFDGSSLGLQRTVHLYGGESIKVQIYPEGGPGPSSFRITSTPVVLWDEVADGHQDAGQTLATAQVPVGSGALDRISGRYDHGETREGIDIYKIRVCDPASFIATSRGPEGSHDGNIGELFLFDANGYGVTFSDDAYYDDGHFDDRPYMTGQFLPAQPADYYLAVTWFERDEKPISLSGAMWELQDENIERAPDGPGAADPMIGWTVNNLQGSGSYRVALTGVCFVETTPPCPADFNHVNGVTVQDIFDFLTAWLAGNPSADFNHVNGVTVQDIFDFLTAWLAGC